MAYRFGGFNPWSAGPVAFGLVVKYSHHDKELVSEKWYLPHDWKATTGRGRGFTSENPGSLSGLANDLTTHTRPQLLKDAKTFQLYHPGVRS